MKPDPRVVALCSIARLRVEAAQRRLSLARKVEAEAREALEVQRELQRQYETEMPAQRTAIYAKRINSALTRGDVDMMLCKLDEVDAEARRRAKNVDVAMLLCQTTTAARQLAQEACRLTQNSQRRRHAMGDHLATIARAVQEKSDEAELDEWRQRSRS